MIPNSEPTLPPYRLQMWPAHLLAVAAFGVTLATMVHPSATRQYTWPWLPLLTLCWLAPLAAVVGRLAFRHSWTRPNGLLTTGLALLTGATLLSAAYSPFAEHSILRIWPTVGGVTLFFWLYDWLAESPDQTKVHTRWLRRGITRFGALLACVSVIEWVWHNGGINWTARNEFPFGHSIYTAGAMVLVLPWLTYTTVRAKGIGRLGWLIATVVGLIALLATSSRGGVLAAGAVAALAAGYIVFRASWSRTIKTGVIAVAVFALAIAVYSNPRLRELTRGQGWSAASQESNVQRSAMLEAGAKLGAARPLLGWGPGTIPLVYPQIRHQLNGGVDSVLQLHNTPAQIWATLGAGGVLALGLLFVACARRLWQIIRQPSPSAQPLIAAASLLGYGLFALTDHQLDVPPMNVLLVINLALFFVNERVAQGIPVIRRARWSFSLAAIVILALPLLLTGRDLWARYAYDQSLILFDAGRPAQGFEYLESAAQRAPYDPYYRHQLAGRLLERRKQVSDASELVQLTARARNQLEQSLAAGCLQEFAHFNLGWLELESPTPAKAIPHFLATVQEAPHRGGAYFGLGLALRTTGNETAAVRAFALEWINDPAAFTAPLWEWPDFAPLRPKITREANALLAELAPTQPTARYIRELWSWWEQGAPPPTNGFNGETTFFANTLVAFAQNQPPPAATAQYPWGQLLNTWQQLPGSVGWTALAGKDASFAAVLARRAERHSPPHWHGFLTAGLENEPSLLTNMLFSRLGYGVLALHPDGPVLTNLYLMQQNRFVSTFAATLFPSKGWLPARELLDRLPAQSATP